jgi:hypothetical protein
MAPVSRQIQFLFAKRSTHSLSSVFATCFGSLSCSNYDLRQSQVLNSDIIKMQYGIWAI